MNAIINTTMNATIHKDRIIRIVPIYEMDQVLGNAGAIKTSVFGKVKEKIYRIRAEDVMISKYPLRYEPFWHVSCEVRYEYDRIFSHDVINIAPEVHHLTINGNLYAPVDSKPRKLTISGIEHCTTKGKKEVIIDAISGKDHNWKNYLVYEKEFLDDNAECFNDKKTFIPPVISSENLVYMVICSLPKPINANKIHEGTANIHFLTLYYRPIYAFEYKLETTGETTVVDFDGITGREISKEDKLQDKIKKIMTSDLLLDVSVEAANLVIPGINIPIKIYKAMSNE